MKIFVLIISALVFTNAYTAEQRFVITEADGRTFLLDTEKGECWRYYFQTTNDQGWQPTHILLGDLGEEGSYYTAYPGAEMFHVPKIKPKTKGLTSPPKVGDHY